MSLSFIRVVLVATTHAGNIGATARAMKNMGLTQLVLVTPKYSLPHPDASARASGADDILENALTVNSLEEALTGCHLVLGTSARERQIPWPLLSPREAAQKSIAAITNDQHVAFVFGREHAGLTNEELQQCNYHIHIPSDETFSSLNVASAVQVISYEARMAWLETKQLRKETSEKATEQPCTHDDLERFYKHLEQLLIAIEFLDPAQPKHLMTRIRKLYGKAQLSKVEMNILRGILTETEKSLRK